MNLLESARGLFRPKAKALAEVQQFSSKDAVDFLLTIPDLAEAFTRADIELALDDRGWLTPGRQWTAADLDAQTRTTLVAKSRLYWLRDPVMKHAVRLWTDYALGQGISWESSEPKIKQALDDFAEHRRNKSIMNSEGQRQSSKKLLVDGELFFALFDAEGSDPKTIRRIDCLQITDIVTDPDDEEHVLGYRRLTAQDKTLFYADWRCDDDDLQLLSEQPDPASKSAIGDRYESNCRVYHLAFDTLLKRGNGLLFSCLDWSKENRRFMEARVAITQALAKFAWKTKVKGGQSIVNDIQRKIQSTYATSGMSMIERHPQNAPGSTLVENMGIDWTPTPRVTGASDAMQDMRMLKLMVCAGTGIMEHYFGDGANANLATATAMELPMLKMFQSYQTFWKDAFYDLFEIALGEDLDAAGKLNIDFPQILIDDVRKVGQFVKFVYDVFPEIRVAPVLRSLLTSLNIENIDDVMEEVENNRAQLDDQEVVAREHALTLAQVQAGKLPAGSRAAEDNHPNVNKTGGAKDVKGKLAAQSSGIPNNPETGYGTTESEQGEIESLEAEERDNIQATLQAARELAHLQSLVKTIEEVLA